MGILCQTRLSFIAARKQAQCNGASLELPPQLLGAEFAVTQSAQQRGQPRRRTKPRSAAIATHAVHMVSLCLSVSVSAMHRDCPYT